MVANLKKNMSRWSVFLALNLYSCLPKLLLNDLLLNCKYLSATYGKGYIVYIDESG